MRKLASRRVALAAALGVGLLAASAALASTAEPSENPARALEDPTLQAELMLSFDTGAPLPSTRVTESDAVAIAADWLGRPDPPAITRHGYGQRTISEAVRPVWIIVYAGGEAPPFQLPGALETTVDFTGVIVDDQSGEVLRAFGKGHQP
jgi:hypothetical protein